MAELVGGDRREALRVMASDHRPDIVASFDEDQRRAAEQEAKWRRENEAWKRERPKQYRLDELVENYYPGH